MEVAIVGAGIMGRLLAWEVLRAGGRPVLFDRDGVDAGGAAAYTAAGMLAPWCEVESAERRLWRMAMRGLALWPDLAAELGDVGFRDAGTLVVAHAHDRADLARFRLALEGNLDAEGREGFRALDRPALAAAEPALAGRFGEALYLPGEACVDNLRVMAALARRLREGGAVWHAGVEVAEVRPHEVVIGKTARTFEWVADCRGLGARRDLPGLRGVRGELLQVAAPRVDIRHMVRLMHPRYRLYLVPGPGDSYLLGATQIESEDYSPISVRSALELLSALYSLHEGFGEARIIASRSNCRPALPDNLPLVDARPGLLRINGLFRHGFLLGPLLARYGAALLAGRTPSEEVELTGGMAC